MSLSPSTRRRRRAALAASAVVVALGLASLAIYMRRPDRVIACEASESATPYCGFVNPEDMVALPSGWVLVSEFQPTPSPPGALVAFHPEHGRERLFPTSEAPTGVERAASGCRGAPGQAFAPHGLGLRLGAETMELLVVNHGREVEAIELFEVEDGAGARPPTLSWSDCVSLPPGKWPNDVSPTPDGGFVTTSMLPALGSLSALRSTLGWALFGSTTGEVLVHSPEGEWTTFPGSELSMPNGILASDDGEMLYVAEWGKNRVHRLERSGRRLTVEVSFRPDNLSRARDGGVLVTGQSGSFTRVVGCNLEARGACALPFEVVKLDPDDLSASTLIDDPGRTTGATSVALEIDQGILVGSYAGDRIVLYSH